MKKKVLFHSQFLIRIGIMEKEKIITNKLISFILVIIIKDI